jgi:hypothetical protein
VWHFDACGLDHLAELGCQKSYAALLCARPECFGWFVPGVAKARRRKHALAPLASGAGAKHRNFSARSIHGRELSTRAARVLTWSVLELGQWGLRWRPRAAVSGERVHARPALRGRIAFFYTSVVDSDLQRVSQYVSS